MAVNLENSKNIHFLNEIFWRVLVYFGPMNCRTVYLCLKKMQFSFCQEDSHFFWLFRPEPRFNLFLAPKSLRIPICNGVISQARHNKTTFLMPSSQLKKNNLLEMSKKSNLHAFQTVQFWQL